MPEGNASCKTSKPLTDSELSGKLALKSKEGLKDKVPTDMNNNNTTETIIVNKGLEETKLATLSQNLSETPGLWSFKSN